MGWGQAGYVVGRQEVKLLLMGGVYGSATTAGLVGRAGLADWPLVGEGRASETVRLSAEPGSWSAWASRGKVSRSSSG